MWICPKCGREFKKTNQSHFCGKAPENVDEYITLQTLEAQVHLIKLRTIIRKFSPEVKERIAWSMPVFEDGKKSISMAAHKNYISLYVDMEAIELFKLYSSEFKIKKNAIYFSYNAELPIKIIEDVLKQYFQMM